MGINTMMLPIPQELMPGPTRTLKNIPGDFAYLIAAQTGLKFHDEFGWQKQTSPNMFGAGLRPGNNISNNTTERITVFVKDGPARKFAVSEPDNTHSEARLCSADMVHVPGEP